MDHALIQMKYFLLSPSSLLVVFFCFIRGQDTAQDLIEMARSEVYEAESTGSQGQTFVPTEKELDNYTKLLNNPGEVQPHGETQKLLDRVWAQLGAARYHLSEQILGRSALNSVCDRVFFLGGGEDWPAQDCRSIGQHGRNVSWMRVWPLQHIRARIH